MIALLALAVNIPLGHHRQRFRKMTWRWWIMIHASIPLIIPLRIWLNTPAVCIPLFIGMAIAGQLIGSKWIPKR
ncbi:MAG: hypothetical protein LUE93_17405 [Bacteroides sp.]|nr:hypothetical protein [Bacteroides sp.]